MSLNHGSGQERRRPAEAPERQGESASPRAASTLFGRPRDWRAKLGFVLLPNERTVERDMFLMAPPGVGVYFTRGAMPREINVRSLNVMLESLADAVTRILPDEDLDVVCYACTSGTVAVGEERVIAELKRGAPEVTATTLWTGVLEALRTINARRIVVGTPYTDEINALQANYLKNCGFEILEFQGLSLRYDSEMVRVDPAFLLQFAKEIARPGADAIFISCGALRGVEVIDAIEQATGKRVVTSNQAMLWHCLRLAGIEDRFSGYGSLLKDY